MDHVTVFFPLQFNVTFDVTVLGNGVLKRTYSAVRYGHAGDLNSVEELFSK